MAKAEVKELEPKLAEAQAALELALLPRDPLDEKDVVLEIRAGTGGDEAALFAGELFDMYQRYAQQRSWSVEVMSGSSGRAGPPRAARAGHREPGPHPHLRGHRRRAARRPRRSTWRSTPTTSASTCAAPAATAASP
jgi:peptide chain release factor 1